MTETKKWWQSKAVWGSVIAFGAGVAQAFGVGVDAGTQQAVTDGVQQVVTATSNHDIIGIVTNAAALAGSALAVYGRIKADTKIGG